MSAATDVPHIHLQRVYDVQGPLRTPRFWWTGSCHAVFEKSDWKARSGLKRLRPAQHCVRHSTQRQTRGTLLLRSIAPNWHNNAIGRSLRRHLRARVKSHCSMAAKIHSAIMRRYYGIFCSRSVTSEQTLTRAKKYAIGLAREVHPLAIRCFNLQLRHHSLRIEPQFDLLPGAGCSVAYLFLPPGPLRKRR